MERDRDEGSRALSTNLGHIWLNEPQPGLSIKSGLDEGQATLTSPYRISIQFSGRNFYSDALIHVKKTVFESRHCKVSRHQQVTIFFWAIWSIFLLWAKLYIFYKGMTSTYQYCWIKHIILYGYEFYFSEYRTGYVQNYIFCTRVELWAGSMVLSSTSKYSSMLQFRGKEMYIDAVQREEMNCMRGMQFRE